MNSRVYDTVIGPRARMTGYSRVALGFVYVIGLKGNLPGQLGERKFIGEIDGIEEGAPENENPTDQEGFDTQQSATPQHRHLLADLPEAATIGFLQIIRGTTRNQS